MGRKKAKKKAEQEDQNPYVWLPRNLEKYYERTFPTISNLDLNWNIELYARIAERGFQWALKPLSRYLSVYYDRKNNAVWKALLKTYKHH